MALRSASVFFFEFVSGLVHDHAVAVVAVSGTHGHEHGRTGRHTGEDLPLVRVGLQHPGGGAPRAAGGGHVDLFRSVGVRGERVPDELHDRVRRGARHPVGAAYTRRFFMLVSDEQAVGGQEEHGTVIHALALGIAFEIGDGVASGPDVAAALVEGGEWAMRRGGRFGVRHDVDVVAGGIQVRRSRFFFVDAVIGGILVPQDAGLDEVAFGYLAVLIVEHDAGDRGDLPAVIDGDGGVGGPVDGHAVAAPLGQHRPDVVIDVVAGYDERAGDVALAVVGEVHAGLAGLAPVDDPVHRDLGVEDEIVDEAVWFELGVVRRGVAHVDDVRADGERDLARLAGGLHRCLRRGRAGRHVLAARGAAHRQREHHGEDDHYSQEEPIPPPRWFFRFLPFSSVLPSKDGIGFHARTMTPRIRISCEQQRYAQRREHVGRHHGQRNRTRVDDL